ncbi:hypothetical protein [Stygiolobus caldivivus]|uniref:Uncharacterized protein n=1 Tax=Stygiolobus caldivivus TaxID=2824673 RepID=A0A8D5U7V3_9CREN|nr:hypothetical protein [Stygiolobus caldivivus]BCU71216.1 hypothetical protein KN1_25130 [Stygiolobus caldivivus]
MQAVVSYYKIEPIELIPGLIGYKVIKEKEDNIDIKSEDEAEKISPQDSVYAIVVSSDRFKATNAPSAIRYTLPEPLKILRIGYPKDAQNPDAVSMEYITFFDKDYRLIGLDITEKFDKPFVILDFENGFTKVVSKGEINSKPKGTKEMPTTKKANKKVKSKKKKSGKRTGSRQKAKSKSTRKS